MDVLIEEFSKEYIQNKSLFREFVKKLHLR